MRRKRNGRDDKLPAGTRKGSPRKESGGFSKKRGTNSPVSRGKLESNDGSIRLNRYLASAGIASRRKADELITAGAVTVNGQPVTEMGFKVKPGDQVRFNGRLLKPQRFVYLLLNKPKDYITTTSDPQERKTVMELIKRASSERVYPVGRLDRNTTGLLLLTNDGDLAEKLSHPRNRIPKVYYVTLNKALKEDDLRRIQEGLTLEDGPIHVDDIAYVEGGSKKEIGVEIHSGRNRIVRRIFESLDYQVIKLDRVLYANLTKKDLPRGKWRLLKENEIIQLKHLLK
ncbi:MAG: pseudouridine synthase [Solitalea sp.]